MDSCWEGMGRSLDMRTRATITVQDEARGKKTRGHLCLLHVLHVPELHRSVNLNLVFWVFIRLYLIWYGDLTFFFSFNGVFYLEPFKNFDIWPVGLHKYSCPRPYQCYYRNIVRCQEALNLCCTIILLKQNTQGWVLYKEDLPCLMVSSRRLKHSSSGSHIW